MESPPHIQRRLLPWRSRIVEWHAYSLTCSYYNPPVFQLHVQGAWGPAVGAWAYDIVRVALERLMNTVSTVARFISSVLSVAVELCEKRRPNG